MSYSKTFYYQVQWSHGKEWSDIDGHEHINKKEAFKMLRYYKNKYPSTDIRVVSIKEDLNVVEEDI